MKKKRNILFFILTSLFLLFYPGSEEYFQVFAYHRPLFKKRLIELNLTLHSTPYIKNSFPPQLSAKAVYLVDLPSFTPVFQKNPHLQLLPASTTKIITALVVNDVFKPEKVITIKQPITEGQTMGLVPGEKITVRNLLYGTLIHSANDATYALANAYGYKNFIKLMNKKAQSLKMANTHFVNPAGFDNLQQYSSVFDLSLAARELLKNPFLTGIIATKEITIADTGFTKFHRLNSTNKLLGKITGIGGLKTGYTEGAGENLVSFYKHKNHQYIIVVLKSKNRFKDTQILISWLDNNVRYSPSITFAGIHQLLPVHRLQNYQLPEKHRSAQNNADKNPDQGNPKTSF